MRKPPGRTLGLVVVGALITLTLALTEQRDAARERELLFQGAVERVQRSLEAELDDELVDFRSTVRFVEATHPGPLDQYQDFVDVDLGDDGQAGALLLEKLSRGEMKTLIDRERLLGNKKFAPILIPVTGSHRLIVTRADSAERLLGVPSMGLDLTTSLERLLPGGLPDEDVELQIVPSNQLVTMMQFVSEQPSADHTLILVAPVHNGDNLVGYSLVFRSMDLLLDRVEPELTTGLGLQVNWEGAQVGQRGEIRPDARQATSEASLEIAGNELLVQLSADPRFGPGTGLADQRGLLATGLAVTVIAAVTDWRRVRGRRRLLETESALAQARTIARSDPLTGLLNRTGFLDAARLGDSDHPATVFFIDLDGFKSINDENGHDAGDQLLARVAAGLMGLVRGDDLLARYGGDEFVALVLTEHEDSVRTIADRMVEAVERADPRISCSIGLAIRPLGATVDIEELIRQADGAMYAAKVAGGARAVTTTHAAVRSL